MPRLSEDRITSIKNKYKQRLDEKNPTPKGTVKAAEVRSNDYIKQAYTPINRETGIIKSSGDIGNTLKSPEDWENYVLDAPASERDDRVVTFILHHFRKSIAHTVAAKSDMLDEIYIAISNYGAVVNKNPILALLNLIPHISYSSYHKINAETLNTVSNMLAKDVLEYPKDFKGAILKILLSEGIENRSDSDIAWLIKTAKFLDDPENKVKYFKGKEKTINAAALMFDNKGNLLDISSIKKNLAANQSSEPKSEKDKSDKSDNLAAGKRGVNKSTVRQVRSIVPNMKEADLKELKSLINNVLNSMKKRNTDGKN